MAGQTPITQHRQLSAPRLPRSPRLKPGPRFHPRPPSVWQNGLALTTPRPKTRLKGSSQNIS
ncbi:hypothetical protein E2C01_061388 [Portunus trituberculatus]|uniref:Uncharacterized protein n=1 Tax=Portunus trituberculatus TaxID=210409 RepID=A0A5B7HBJ0_PORTR|nr:hypothetical protein [Portunus trituberculatus]